MLLLYDRPAIFQKCACKNPPGAHAKFSELFVKTGIFPIEISNDISVIFDFRQEADYDLDTDISHEEAKDLIKRASSFYQLTKAYLQELVQDSK